MFVYCVKIRDMKIKNLTNTQLRILFCSAMGWHSRLDINENIDFVENFNKFYEQELFFQFENDRWNIRSNSVQIEITEDLFFRCGHIVGGGIGGTAFDLRAVYKCLKDFGFNI